MCKGWKCDYIHYRIRGTLCSILVLGSTGGVLLGFIAGHFLEYAETPQFALMFPILYIAFFSFFPETPYYLMKSNRMEVRSTWNIIFHCGREQKKSKNLFYPSHVRAMLILIKTFAFDVRFISCSRMLKNHFDFTVTFCQMRRHPITSHSNTNYQNWNTHSVSCSEKMLKVLKMHRYHCVISSIGPLLSAAF